MFEHRHAAYNVKTGELITCNHGNHLKRAVALDERFNREVYNQPGEWRWCHDFGRKWEEKLPTK